MATTFYLQFETSTNDQKQLKCNYSPDESYLKKLGFLKLEVTAGRKELVFRYHNLNKKGKGFDLLFSDDFSILTIEEFMPDTKGTGINSYRNTIVGMFHIESDDDLKFIFSRNVRLNYVFNISPKKMYGAG